MVEQPFSPDPLPPGSRVACSIEYNGRDFSGWQSQPHLNVTTVQEVLEEALSAIAAKPIRVHCAGRTDAGVHGLGQIAHFDDPVGRSCKAWVMGTNASLPRSVRVHWARPVPQEFHARFSAQARRYRYIISNTVIRPALMEGMVTWYRAPLDAAKMHEAAQALLGEQDFSAFRAASCQSSTPMRNMHSIAVHREDDCVLIDLTANAFLHHMVRNIVGSLMAVGCGKKPVHWLGELLAGRNRAVAADTAAADGLYLAGVDYPAEFGLPKSKPGPRILTP
ncbi:MAG: tRNA pseudouridine(38-40) synthase TruA [Halioglobus sp.]